MTEQKAAERGEIMWLVRDTLATTKPRTHEIWVTEIYKTGPQKVAKRFTFPPYEQIKVPMEGAMTLVGIDGFEVHTADGKLVRPRPAGEAEQDIKLKPGEVVAKLDELDMGALRTRARGLPGGDVFVTNRTKKDELCSFILGGGDGPVAAMFAEDDEDDDDLELEDED